MLGLLFRRLLRFCRENIVQYGALLVLVITIVTVIVSLEATALTVLDGREKNAALECIEDGQFVSMFEIPDDELDSYCEKYNVEIQKNYTIDVESGDVLYRVIKHRDKIDKLVLKEGCMPNDDSSIVVEQLYARDSNLKIGDKLSLADHTYTICGIGSIPDYVKPTRNRTDVAVTTSSFSWVEVSESEYDRIYYSGKWQPEYTYSYISKGDTDVKAFSKDLGDDIFLFTESEDNIRMGNDVFFAEIYGVAGFILGALLVAMLAIIFGVVTKNLVRREHTVIGSLYALGIKKGTILMMYILPSVIVALIGGILGIIIGYTPTMSGIAIKAFHTAISFPFYELSKPASIFIYAVVMPPIVCAIINFLILNRLLSQPALTMIRGTFEGNKDADVQLKSEGFIRKFQLRRLIEEKGALIVFVGVFIAMSLFMLGYNTEMLVENNKAYNNKYHTYDYLCLMKYPSLDIDTSGEKVYVQDVKTESCGENVTISLVGISKDSKIYGVQVDDDKNTVIINGALASKLNLKKDDTIVFRKTVTGEEYTANISDIVDTSATLEMYMSIGSMQELLNEDADYYNAIAFKGEPDINDYYVYSRIKQKDIEKSFDMLRDIMKSFLTISYISSVLIFIISLYLIVSMMIDRNASGISLMRVFGFTTWEIQRMYVNPLILSVSVAMLLAIPVAKLVCDAFMPYIYIKFAMGMFTQFPFASYVLIFIVAIGIFGLILATLMLKLSRINTQIILKTRE